MPIPLQKGDAAPDFEALAHDGRTVRLRDFRGQRVVLYFYPKDDTPGCTTQACLFRDHQEDFQARNAVVLGVSPDDAASHRRFRERHDLPFTLLVDTDHRLAQQYGVWGEKSMYGKKYMGIIRSHFVIDEEGRILDASIKVSPKKSVQAALEQLPLPSQG